MIVSTSSCSVALTDDLHRLLEGCVHRLLEPYRAHVVSVDARLEQTLGKAARAVLRVDLRDCRSFTVETSDDNLAAAIRRSIADCAAVVADASRGAGDFRRWPMHAPLFTLDRCSVSSA